MTGSLHRPRLHLSVNVSVIHLRQAWLDAFVRLRADVGLREQLIASGRRQAHRYRWQRTAEVYLEEMARMDEAVATNGALPPSHSRPPALG